MNTAFVSGEKSTDPKQGDHYDPDRAAALATVKELTQALRGIVQENRIMPYRCQTVAIGLLLRHAEYADGVAAFLKEKAIGHDEEALRTLDASRIRFGRYELELERYFDHSLAFVIWERVKNAAPNAP